MRGAREMAAEGNERKPFLFLSKETYAGILVVIVFLVSNERSLLCEWNAACRYSNTLADYVVWGGATWIALLLLPQFGKTGNYLLAWRRNVLLILFILYSIASISWSIVPQRSFHTVFIMLAASLIGGALVMIFSPPTILKILFYILFACALASLLFVIFYPRQGIHQDAVWFGAWKGIFQHKNDFGPLMALGNGLALLSFLSESNRSRKNPVCFCLCAHAFSEYYEPVRNSCGILGNSERFDLLYFAWMRWGAKWRSQRKLFIIILISVFARTFLVTSIFLVMGKNYRINRTGAFMD